MFNVISSQIIAKYKLQESVLSVMMVYPRFQYLFSQSCVRPLRPIYIKLSFLHLFLHIPHYSHFSVPLILYDMMRILQGHLSFKGLFMCFLYNNKGCYAFLCVCEYFTFRIIY